MGVGCGCLLTLSAFRMSANSRLRAYLSKYGIIYHIYSDKHATSNYYMNMTENCIGRKEQEQNLNYVGCC